MASLTAEPTDLDDARRFLRGLRKAVDRGALGLSRPRGRGMSQEEAARLISEVAAPEHVSERWLRRLEALDVTWSQEVADAYAGLLQLHDSELDIFFRVVNRQPPADTLEGDLVPADVEYLNGTLAAPSYLGDPYWDMRARNPAMAAMVPRFRPGINIIEYVLTDPEARDVLVDWDAWAIRMVMQIRSTLLKSTGVRKEGLAAIARRCRADDAVAPLWDVELEPRLSPNGEIRLLRPADPSSPTGLGEPVRIKLYSTVPASKTQWRYMSLIPLDPLPAVPAPPEEDGTRWFPRPALLFQNTSPRVRDRGTDAAGPAAGGSVRR
jgi:hypothetical protein